MKRLSKRGAALIHEFEGLRLTAYQDQAGVWTIGWGHTGPDARPGNTITRQRADELFDADVRAAETVVNRLDKLRLVLMSQQQYDAAVSFQFNTGALANQKYRVTQHLINGRDDLVDDEMLRWVHITDPKTKAKVVSAGLKRRRLAEAKMWIEGSAPALSNASGVHNAAGATPVPLPPPSPAQEVAASPGVQGSTVATASAILATATEGIQPLAAYSDTLRIIFVCLALAGVAFAIYGAMRPRRRLGAAA